MKKTIIFTATLSIVIFYACTKDNGFIINDGLSPNNIIQITSVNPVSAYADSNSQIKIRINIFKNAYDSKFVKLTTSAGRINNRSQIDSVQVNADRFADFILTTGQLSGPVQLRASVLGLYFRDTIIEFIKSYPDSIIIQPDSYTISKNSVLHVSINLFRNQGYPSKNQSFQFFAADSIGHPAGQFISTDNFVPGMILNATFTPITDFIGKVLLSVFVIKQDGSFLKGTIQIKVQ